MHLLQFPLMHESWFFGLALALSLLLGFRGIVILMHNVENENRELEKKNQVQWERWQRVLVHYYQGFIYNFVGSFVGWFSLYILSYRLFNITGPGLPPPPTGYLLVQPNLHLLGWPDLALAVFALLGITGKLPQTVEGFIRSIAQAVETIVGKVAK